jgi:hypothetical protein
MTVLSKEDFAVKYGIEVRFIHELPAYLASKGDKTIYVNEGVNSDSGRKTSTPD